MLPGLPAEAQLACVLCRATIPEPLRESAHAIARRGIDCARFLDFVFEHEIHPLVDCHASQNLPDLFPCDVRDRLRATAAVSAKRSEAMAQELVAVLDLLESAAIRAVPLKGPVLAERIWGDCRRGISLDLDLLVKPDDARRAADLLLRRGYTFDSSGLDALPRWKHGLDRIELSRDHPLGFPLRIDLHTRALPDWIGAPRTSDVSWDRLRRRHFQGNSIWTLPDDWTLVLVALHGLGHLFGSLRWVAALHGLVQVCPEAWPLAEARADEVGARRELVLARRVCDTILDVERPAADGDRLLMHLARRPFLPARFSLRDHTLQLALRRNMAAKLAYVFSGIFEPRPSDVELVPLPRSLSPLYYLIRPVRLAAKYLVRKPLAAARQSLRRRFLSSRNGAML